MYLWLQQIIELLKLKLSCFAWLNLYNLIFKTQKYKSIKLKEADIGKQSFSKLTGAGSGQISVWIFPVPVPNFFLNLGTGRIWFWIFFKTK